MGTDGETGRSRRLTADDWIEAATRMIAEAGVSAVAVEPLAKRLGVTKGSFYWHFPNRDALLQATLERWEREDTEAAIAALEAIADPHERLRRLIVQALSEPSRIDDAPPSAFDFGHAFHLAVADAADDPIVRPILRRVSERRVDYLVECYRALGLAPEEARHWARLAYAAYIGTLRLWREAPGRAPAGAAAAAYRSFLTRALVPSSGEGAPAS